MPKDDRWKDPEAWKCLDDEQREIINEWYKLINEIHDNEEKLEESRNVYSTIFLSIPISVFYLHGFSNSGLPIWKYFLEIAAGFLVIGTMLYIGKNAITFSTSDCESEKILALKSLGVSVVLAFVADCICSLIY